MSEIDVEKTLREIRAAVRAQLDEAAFRNGPVVASQDQPTDSDSRFSSTIIRLEADIASAQRAADRLPPVSSDRSGVRARFELWFKRKAKIAMRWFTWEQVNFNVSVRDSLLEIASLIRGLDEQQRRSSIAHDELDVKLSLHQTDTDTRLSEVAAGLQNMRGDHSDLETRIALIESQFNSDVEELRKLVIDIANQLRTSIENTHSDWLAATKTIQDGYSASLADVRSEVQRVADQLKESDETLNRRLDENVIPSIRLHQDELRELVASQSALVGQFVSEQREHLLQHDDEMRVLFKQLSLEAGEHAVLVDRVKRALDAKIDALVSRLAEVEGLRAQAAKQATKPAARESAASSRKR